MAIREETGRVFLQPVDIYYYEVIGSEFEEHPDSGCMMPIEDITIDVMQIHNNRELLDFWLKKDDWDYPIPVELQLFMGFMNMMGLYEDEEVDDAE